MAAGHPPPIDSERLTGSSALEAVDAWCTPLQLACRLEAEAGFGDLQGRQDRFSGFVGATLSTPVAGLEAVELQQLTALARDFGGYGALALAGRQSLVRKLRQLLHDLRCRRREVLPVAPPRLRMVPPSAAERGGNGAAVRLTAQTPLAEVAGIGPKTATRLAALGLLVVRDLVHH